MRLRDKTFLRNMSSLIMFTLSIDAISISIFLKKLRNGLLESNLYNKH